MAPKSRAKHERQSNYMKHAKFWKTYIEKKFTKEFLFSLLWDPKRLPIVSVFLVLAEIILNIFVIHRVKYTEIDWIAYMQEVEGVVNGTLDYTHLKGDTGPLVYPAGFVYIFTVLYYLTNQGQNIRLAQYIFAGFYIVLLSLVLRLYSKTNKVPPYVIILACCTSYRIHSIFVLRLFNDPVAMLLFYVAVNLFLDSKWSLGSLFYSLAVSVKMNILLFAPALLLAYLTSLGLKGALIQLTICAFTQLILGLPFLLSNPIAYLKGSFNLGRIFLYEWTVNWRFLPEEVFINQYFHLGLLVLHLALLACFYSSALHCLCSYSTLKQVSEKVRRQLKGKKEKVDMGAVAQLFILPLFTANLVGVACSRSLHYQFYVWYFHTLPYLMWATPYSNIARLCLLGVIEFCWNTFPSTLVSSIALHMCHSTLLYGLWKNKPLGKGRQQ